MAGLTFYLRVLFLIREVISNPNSRGPERDRVQLVLRGAFFARRSVREYTKIHVKKKSVYFKAKGIALIL